jgi:hypothetical protein
MSHYIPEGPNEYQGNQVIINSDRLLFNAKKDSILLFSDKSIGFSTNGTINFDIVTKDGQGIFNIPYIYLGPIIEIAKGKHQLPNEPALLGNKTEVWLVGLLSLIKSLTIKLKGQFTPISSAPGTPTVPNPNNEEVFESFDTQLAFLSGSIKSIQSTRIHLL